MVRTKLFGTFVLSVAAAGVLAAAVTADQRPRQASRSQIGAPRDGALKVGDVAPDFTLDPRGGGAPVSLSSFRGRQFVALVFGSYT